MAMHAKLMMSIIVKFFFLQPLLCGCYVKLGVKVVKIFQIVVVAQDIFSLFLRIWSGRGAVLKNC